MSAFRIVHCLLLLYCTAASADGRIKDQDMDAINFAKRINGKRLNGSLFQNISVDSEMFCQLACVKDVRCLSYNYGTMNNTEGKFNCQLSDSDRFTSHENFTDESQSLYRGIQSICESDKQPCGDKGICIPSYHGNTFTCKCATGYSGIPCEPKSCLQLLHDGINSSGVYTINPDGGEPMQVLCDMTTDGGGWTVFQKRLDGSVDFYLGWASYKNGFGDLNGEFWLGNDNLHRLTAADDVKLRVDLEDFDGNITYAEYTTFKVEGDKYRLAIGGYNGTAGDSLAGHHSLNGMQFTTKDQDNDVKGPSNCAVEFKGAWWYKGCHASNLNGQYLGGPHASYADGINWYSFRGHHNSLKRTEMKIRLKM